MKLRISSMRMTWTFIIAAILVAAIIFGIFFSYFWTWPWTSENIDHPNSWWVPYMLIAIWAALTIFFYILTLTSNYYLVSKSEVVSVRFRRKTHYRFDNIIYIDEKASKKRKMVCFFTKDGYRKYLTFDRKGKLYTIMIKNCKNLVSEEQFRNDYPNVKF